MPTIQLRRGPKADISTYTSAQVGEMLVTTDTNELWAGQGTGSLALPVHYRPRVFVVSYAASVTLNQSLYNHGDTIRIVLTGNITLGFSNGVDGQDNYVELVQDSTGGRTTTFGSSIRYTSQGGLLGLGTYYMGWNPTTTALYTNRALFHYTAYASVWDLQNWATFV